MVTVGEKEIEYHSKRRIEFLANWLSPPLLEMVVHGCKHNKGCEGGIFYGYLIIYFSYLDF